MKLNIKTLLVAFSFLLMYCNQKDIPQPNSISDTKNPEPPKKTLIFFGDSLTAGMGLPGVEYSYANILYNKIQSIGYDYKLINAGLSGDTTSGGLTRLDWVLSKGVDLFVLELGANDMMRGISPEEISKNLKEIILRVKKKNPQVKILIIPMKPFPNLGKEYGKRFESVYTDISTSTGVPLTRFLLENVAGIPALNQKDGIHPTIEGHKRMAETIWKDLEAQLE